jgi:DNA-binding response OmpR family regulator
MRLLVVEDDPAIASFLVKGLKEAGFAVDPASSGGAALEMASRESYDLAIIDLMLPGMDGLALIEELRRRRLTLPVIILSAKRSVDDRVRGLQAGGDDYLTKPFAFEELLARVQALIRRSTGTVEPTRLTVGDLALDLVSRKVERGGRALDLRPREYALLEYLMRNPGRVVSEGHDPLARLRLQLRPTHERGGRPRPPPAREGRQGVPYPDDPHRARHGICPPPRVRSCRGR